MYQVCQRFFEMPPISKLEDKVNNSQAKANPSLTKALQSNLLNLSTGAPNTTNYNKATCIR